MSVSPSKITAAELGELCEYIRPAEETPAPISRIAAGIVFQELLMNVGNVRLAAPLEKMVLYNAAAEDRVTPRMERPWTPDPVDNVIVDAVAAGGIGINVLESILPMLGSGSEIRVYDSDVVGPENLSTQSLFSAQDVGRPKAIVAAEKLQPINPNVNIRPMVMRYQQQPSGLSRCSVRTICPDNWQTRVFANFLSTRYDGVPLTEAGSSPLSAQQRTYYPGLTACLEHRIHNLVKKAAEESEPNSCSANPALTLPGTNAIIGGILAVETLKVLDPKRFGGSPSRGTIGYDAREPQRFGILDVRPPCKHDRQGETNNI